MSWPSADTNSTNGALLGASLLADPLLADPLLADSLLEVSLLEDPLLEQELRVTAKAAATAMLNSLRLNWCLQWTSGRRMWIGAGHRQTSRTRRSAHVCAKNRYISEI